ncbi:MAG: IS481 family transposase, partial [Rubrivivax sp.]|nr:IS481 family transposase [Rubrivivax sp.]
TYNHLIPQRALGNQAPIEALKSWQAKRPELFVKRVYKRPGLNT